MRKSCSSPAFLKLSRIAREIGIRPETIEANKDDFFGVTRLGSQRYVLATEFQDWIARHMAAPGKTGNLADTAALSAR